MKKRPKEVYWTGVNHHNYNSERMYPAYWDSDQLYDLNTDLYEQNNVATKAINKVILDKLKKQLGKHLKTMPHAFGEFGKY